MRKHFVTFYSPGTFFVETTTKPIDSWDPVEAVKLAKCVVERYNALPYGFRFYTKLVADPIPDGEGDWLETVPKDVDNSGVFFLGGKIRTIDEIESLGLEEEHILRSNMKCNDIPIVIENNNSWKSTQPFNEEDCIVNMEGKIEMKGNDPSLVGYRAIKITEHKKGMGNG